jgi:AcrR family transcriptional regulator
LQANLRGIAEQAGVATSLVIKHFGAKKDLFAEALTIALRDAQVSRDDRSRFGERLVDALLDPRVRILTPAMIALSLEDEEARLVAAKVARDHMIAPTAEWIGQPQAEARAANLLTLSIGFALFQRHLKAEISKEAREISAKWFAKLIQSVVDNTPHSNEE